MRDDSVSDAVYVMGTILFELAKLIDDNPDPEDTETEIKIREKLKKQLKNFNNSFSNFFFIHSNNF